MFEKSYPYDIGDLGPRDLNESLHNIGALISIFSDIEHLLTLIIIKETGITELQAYIILGRMNISGKLGKVETLLKSKDREDEYKAVFDSGFSNYLKLRNTFAHGFYLGTTKIDKGKTTHMFRTADIKELDRTGGAVLQVAGLTDGSIAVAAKDCIEYERKIIEHFDLQPLLEKSLQQALVPLKQARKPSKKS